MAASYEHDGNALVTVRRGEVTLTQVAELGAVGNSQLVINDKPGTLDIVGQMDFAADEDDCTNPITARGFYTSRTYKRGASMGPTERDIAASVEDLNAMLSFRVLWKQTGMTAAEGGRRPRETVAARGEWLLASPFVNGLFVDNGRCDFSTTKYMDKADYRTQKPGDVLADMALAQTGVNYYVRDFGDGPELVFRDDNASTADTSDVRISNVIADVTGDMDGLTFYPFKDFTLTRDPGQVISHISYSYEKTTINEYRTATAAAFNGERGGTASNSMVKEEAPAREQARAILWQRHLEEDVLEGEIEVPASAVNLINQGDRMQVRIEYLATEGYGSMTWCRVLEVTKTPLLKPAALYHVRVRLSPQEAAEPTPPEGYIVQSNFTRSAAGGINLTLPNLVTPGNLLVFASCDRGVLDPVAPNTAPDHARFGDDAWTKLPNTTNRTDYTAGVAIWYKVADSTENIGWVQQSSSNMGIWEIAGATITGATTLDESLQPDNNTMSLGSLGAVTDGAVVVAIIAWSDQRGLSEPMPGVTGATGFVTDWFDDAHPSGGRSANTPFTWIGHALGTGAALSPGVTRTDPSQISGIWCGVALCLEPA